jgi:hypothetical protein
MVQNLGHTYVYVSPYDFAMNLITFHVCPYKYLKKHIHKYSFVVSTQYGRLPQTKKLYSRDGQCDLIFAPFCVILNVLDREG